MTTANVGIMATGEESPVADAVQSRQESSIYVGPWLAEHHNVSHIDRLKSEGRLRECDGLAVDVARKQDVLRRELEKLAGRNWRLAQATFSDLFFYLKTFPIHLGTLSDATKAAELEFDAARARYNQECLDQHAPVYVTHSLSVEPAKDDLLRLSVLRVAQFATRGALYVYDHPWQIAGVAALGIALALAPEAAPLILAL